MQPFDPIASRLQGTCLIEAGAGTGKTHTITTLVLRLILQEALTVEQILVVTFTTAATAELRDRLRRRLREAKQVLQGRLAASGDLCGLLSQCGPPATAIERLEDALANFDRMPVFTIHGFCQRILSEMAFETGSSFDAELVADPAPVVQALADDFWRKTSDQSPPECMAFALDKLKQPDDLAALYHRHAAPEIKVVPEDVDPLPAVSCQTFRELWTEAGRQWRRHREDIIQLLVSANLKANIYGSPQRPGDRCEGRSPREKKIAAWADRLDQWGRSTVSGFPPPEALSYFSQTKLDASLKKGSSKLHHGFFESCDHLLSEACRMAAEIEQWFTLLQVRFFRTMDDELNRYKQEQQAFFFDDLLLAVRNALRQDPDGALKKTLRTRYRAALIDEFQDTDAAQYAIFSTLFGDGGHPLFMIGDPKQAIYSFRGADIFTYLKAAKAAAHRYTLTRNWRSTPAMIRAINVLFSKPRHPFLWPDIAFHPASAANEETGCSGDKDDAGSLTIWYLDPPKDQPGCPGWTKPSATKAICEALVREVHRLAAALPQEGRPGVFKDMAILVRTNRQAREVKQVLTEARVPAVVYNAGSVFHRQEALDMRRLLEAASNPADDVKLRTALTTPFFGCKAQELDFGDSLPAWWEAVVDRFFEYRELWSTRGFIRMFRRLMVRESIAPRLLAGSSGERRLTNVLHLAELLHQASVERGLGPVELIQWLDLQRRQDSDPVEAHQIRLESDADAVTIMTIHKSKGLEFPIVFCPFAWEGMGPPSPPALCHDAAHGQQRVLDFGSQDIEAHLAGMAEERMAEEIRLLYVAVTRAKRRCYLVWGRLPSSETSALAYLTGPGGEIQEGAFSRENLRAMRKTFLEADLQAQVSDLVRRSGNAITVTGLPAGAPDLPAARAPSATLLPPRNFTRGPMPVWKIASFSSLINQRHDGAEIIDDFQERQDPEQGPFQRIDAGKESPSIGEIAGFEASARAGLFFHEILEKIDFGQSPESWERVVEDRMQAHGFERRWMESILVLLQRVVAAPLAADSGQSFALRQISPRDRLNELEFHLPLRAIDAVSLGRVFAGCRQPAFEGRLPRLMEQLAFSLSGGYLKGYIDLVFRRDGRYFLADWKSNLLGNAFDAYRPDRLADVMAADYYFLQYHLYTLAVDRYLESSFPGYSYEKHFGGVFYCFIRGMRPPDGSSGGIFFDCPSPALIKDLRNAIMF